MASLFFCPTFIIFLVFKLPRAKKKSVLLMRIKYSARAVLYTFI